MRTDVRKPTPLGRLLHSSGPVRLAELLAVFVVAMLVIAALAPVAGDDPLTRQGIVWVANVLMIGLVWLGLRLRGQGVEHFGLGTGLPNRRTALRAVGLSVAVLVVAVVATSFGAVLASLVPGAAPADLSGYDYLRGNVPMLLLALLAVYVVSSFGEEFVYRGFLITRISELLPPGRSVNVVALPASAVIFGLVHFDWGPAGMVQTGFLGLALGLSYLAVGRRLWVLVLAHVYLDTILLVQVFMAPSASGV